MFSIPAQLCAITSCPADQGHCRAVRSPPIRDLPAYLGVFNSAALHCAFAPQIDDLGERRVDRWIRDFPAATHVLDVYMQKRVDKRRIFASQYLRITELPREAEGEGLLIPALHPGIDTDMGGA